MEKPRKNSISLWLVAVEPSLISPQAALTYETTTDSQGYYSLTSLPAGAYSIAAVQPGATFAPAWHTRTVPPYATF